MTADEFLDSFDGSGTPAPASVFANPADLADYAKHHSLATGDNGVGAWGDDTTSDTEPMVALPRDTITDADHGRQVIVMGASGTPFTARVADKMPATANIRNGARIDLNPAAARLAGHPGDGLAPVRWRFADQSGNGSLGGADAFLDAFDRPQAPQNPSGSLGSADAFLDGFDQNAIPAPVAKEQGAIDNGTDLLAGVGVEAYNFPSRVRQAGSSALDSLVNVPTGEQEEATRLRDLAGLQDQLTALEAHVGSPAYLHIPNTRQNVDDGIAKLQAAIAEKSKPLPPPAPLTPGEQGFAEGARNLAGAFRDVAGDESKLQQSRREAVGLGNADDSTYVKVGLGLGKAADIMLPAVGLPLMLGEVRADAKQAEYDKAIADGASQDAAVSRSESAGNAALAQAAAVIPGYMAAGKVAGTVAKQILPETAGALRTGATQFGLNAAGNVATSTAIRAAEGGDVLDPTGIAQDVMFAGPHALDAAMTRRSALRANQAKIADQLRTESPSAPSDSSASDVPLSGEDPDVTRAGTSQLGTEPQIAQRSSPDSTPVFAPGATPRERADAFLQPPDEGDHLVPTAVRFAPGEEIPDELGDTPKVETPDGATVFYDPGQHAAEDLTTSASRRPDVFKGDELLENGGAVSSGGRQLHEGGNENNPLVRPSAAEESRQEVERIRAGDKNSKNKGIVYNPEQPTGELKKVNFPLGALDPKYVQFLRDSTDEDRVNRYASEVPKAPVYIRPNKAGKLLVNDGGHRVIAAIQRGDKTVPALIPAGLEVPLSSEPELPPPASQSPRTPEELPPGVISTQNSEVDDARAARGLPPIEPTARQDFGTAWDKSGQRIADDPLAGHRLVEELNSKPRALNDEENALLLRRQIEAQTAFDRASDAVNAAKPETLDTAKAAFDRATNDLFDVHTAARAAGAETGRGLNARKMLAGEDYTLAKMLVRRRAANDGKPLNADQTAEVKAAHEKIAALEEKQAAHDSMVQELRDQLAKKHPERALRAAAKAAKPAGNNLVEFLNKQADAARARIISRRGRLNAGFDPSAIADEAIIGASHIARGVKRFGEWSKAMLDDFGERIKPYLLHIFSESKRVHEETLQQLDPERKTPREKALKRLQTVLEDHVAVLDHRLSTGERLPDRGTLEYPPALDALRKQRDDLNSALRQITKRPDLTLEQRIRIATRATERSILSLEKRIKNNDFAPRAQKRVESPELKALRVKRDGLMKEVVAKRKAAKGGARTPEEIATRAALKATQKSIGDLQDRLIQNAIDAKKTPSKVQETPELLAARAQRDQLRQAVDEMVEAAKPPGRTPEEIKLANIKKSLTKRTADLQERLKNEDFAKRTRKITELDEDGLQLKAAHQRAKDTFDMAVERNRLANRPVAQRAADTFVKAERAIKLTGISTLGKIAGATMARVGLTPLEEGVGSITRHLPLVRGVAARAPRFGGGLSLEAERAAAGGTLRGVREIPSILKTGRSDLDVLHGQRRLQPHSPILDAPGAVHGAIANPAARAEFDRATVQRRRAYRRMGLDTDNPLVKARIAAESYQDSQRAVFAQRNFASDAYRNLVRSLEQSKSAPNLGFSAAKILDFLFPVVKKPLNIIGEGIAGYGTGSVTSPIRILYHALRGGINDLPPDVADGILRNLSKGLVGNALMALGYMAYKSIGGQYQPGEKRDKKDVAEGAVRLPAWMGGYAIPKAWFESPGFMAMNVGATIHRISEQFDHRTGGLKGIGEASKMAVLGILRDVPFVSTSSLVSGLLDPNKSDTAAGRLAESTLVPAGVRQAAEYFDQRNPAGQPVKRKPGSIIQSVEAGIPGLRKNVPLSMSTKEDRAMNLPLMSPAERAAYHRQEVEKKANAQKLQRVMAGLR